MLTSSIKISSLGEKYGLRIIPGENAFLVLPNNVSRSSAVGAILAPGGLSSPSPASPKRIRGNSISSWPRSSWIGGLEGDISIGDMVADTDIGLDFVLAISTDEKLLRRLNEIECAETVKSSGRGRGTDAKWTIDAKEVISTLMRFATAK